MFNLWPDQTALIDLGRASLRSNHKAPLLVAPCGFGKTVMFCWFASEVNSRGKRCLILSHRDELVDQISETLDGFNVRHSYIAAGRNFNPKRLTQVASIASLARRLDLDGWEPDLVIIDEAHHAVSPQWSRVINRFRQAWIIGVTATPRRLSGEPLAGMFDDMVVGPSVAELIAAGRLCPYDLYSVANIDDSKARMSSDGDFNSKDAAEVANKPVITGSAVEQYRKYADRKRFVAFCADIKHAHDVAAQFTMAGYPTRVIDGTMPRGERRSIVRAYREGRLNGLCSVDIIAEGFDLPAIEVAICLRITNSLALWIQQLGRALRTAPGKERAVILDHANNANRLYHLPDTHVEWSLAGDLRVGPRKEEKPFKNCPACSKALPLAVSSCPCGFNYPPRDARSAPRVVAGELTKITSVGKAPKEKMGDMPQWKKVMIGVAREKKERNIAVAAGLPPPPESKKVVERIREALKNPAIASGTRGAFLTQLIVKYNEWGSLLSAQKKAALTMIGDKK